MDSRKKSIAKTVSWRVIATVLTVPVVFILTGDMLISLGAGALDAIIKFFGYYLHERAWAHVI